jgi:hypothetical protein
MGRFDSTYKVEYNLTKFRNLCVVQNDKYIAHSFFMANTLPSWALMVEVWIGYVLMHFKMFNNMAANQK